MISNRRIGSLPLRTSEASYSGRTVWQIREMERPRLDRELSVHEIYLHGDLLSCGIIITSIEQLFGPVATKWKMDFTSLVIGAKKLVVPSEL